MRYVLKTIIIEGDKMAKCSKCGKSVSETVKFCPDCGERIKKEAIRNNSLNNPKWIWISILILSFISAASVAGDLYSNAVLHLGGLTVSLFLLMIFGGITVLFSTIVLILKFVKKYSSITSIPFILSLIAGFFSLINSSTIPIPFQIIGIFIWMILVFLSLVIIMK
jgi:predicted RNA-binding Zn-ribbon protein involved in translation (DUF1610 family)